MALPPLKQTFTSYPWRDGNSVQLLVDGEEIFAAMLSAIDDAKTCITLEMYLLESGRVMERFVAAFSHAVARDVKVYLMLDAFGARGLRAAECARLRSAGVSLAFYNPLRYGKWRRNLLRNHRKILIVDGESAIIGGIGLTDEFITRKSPHAMWHDTAMRISGPAVADWREVFWSNWQWWSSIEAPELLAALPGIEELQHAEGQRGRVVSSRRFGAMAIQRGFIQQARRAEESIWIMTAYFVPSRRLRRVLVYAAQRGVDVRLLLPGPITDHPGVRYAGRRFYHSLLEAGVRIFEYQPRFLHAKVFLCDDWVSLGSCNMDRWNLRWNLEGNQEIKDAEFAAEVRALFEEDFALCEECRLPQWQWRPWYRRLQERFWGWVDMRLEGLRKHWRNRN